MNTFHQSIVLNCIYLHLAPPTRPFGITAVILHKDHHVITRSITFRSSSFSTCASNHWRWPCINQIFIGEHVACRMLLTVDTVSPCALTKVAYHMPHTKLIGIVRRTHTKCLYRGNGVARLPFKLLRTTRNNVGVICFTVFINLGSLNHNLYLHTL